MQLISKSPINAWNAQNWINHIVIPEETKPTKKPATFLFLSKAPQNTEDVRAKLLLLPEVLFADYVLGSFDLICGLKAEDHEALQMSVIHIQQISGVEDKLRR